MLNCLARDVYSLAYSSWVVEQAALCEMGRRENVKGKTEVT